MVFHAGLGQSVEDFIKQITGSQTGKLLGDSLSKFLKFKQEQDKLELQAQLQSKQLENELKLAEVKIQAEALAAQNVGTASINANAPIFTRLFPEGLTVKTVAIVIGGAFAVSLLMKR